MKKFLIILFATSSLCTICAEPYKILFANTPTITIGGENLKVGDTFDDRNSIRWSSDKQAVKVQNLRDKKIRIITAIQAKGTNNLYDYFVKTKLLSTRGGFIDIEDLREELTNKFFLLDDISFSQCSTVDDTHYFLMEYQNGDEVKQCKLIVNEKDETVLITRDLFDGVNTDDDITVTIKYVDPEDGTTIITDQMVINVIPLKL